MPTLTDRQPVEGTTDPVIYIGHRLLPKKNGSRKASRKWYAEYCLDAKQRYEALKTSNKGVAISAAHKLAERIARNEQPNTKRRIELSEIVKQYMTMQKNRERAPKTIEKYQYVLDTFVTWATTEAKKTSATAITSMDFWEFNNWMIGMKLTSKTRYDRSIIIKQLYKWASQPKQKMLAHDPLNGEMLPEPQPTKQPCFSRDQVEMLLTKADEHEGAIFAFMAYAGLRIGEVQQLRWSDLTLPEKGEGTIDVQRGGSRPDQTKGKRSRSIPIHAELRKVIDKLPREFETVFTSRPSPKFPKGGAMISERRLLVSLKRLCRRCGFANPDQFKLHTFRHAFASSLAQERTTDSYALNLMGHKSSDIFSMYVTIYDDVARGAINKINYGKKEVSNAPAA